MTVPPGGLYRAPLGLRVGNPPFELRETLAFLAGPTCGADPGHEASGGELACRGLHPGGAASPSWPRGVGSRPAGRSPRSCYRREAAIADDYELSAWEPAPELQDQLTSPLGEGLVALPMGLVVTLRRAEGCEHRERPDARGPRKEAHRTGASSITDSHRSPLASAKWPVQSGPYKVAR